MPLFFLPRKEKGQGLRNDEQIQQAARNLFEGVVPERQEELKALWKQYSPRFNILMDTGPDGLFVMDAGAYRDVRFNHRALRAFWLGSFIAWEGYRAIVEGLNEGAGDLGRFTSMIHSFSKMMKEEDPEAVPLPEGVSEPGFYPDAAMYPQMRASGELATFATGWAFLHEIRHLQHQQEMTSVAIGAPAREQHAEEFSCDEFATRFILDHIDDYAARENVSADKVRQKREIGIYFALFTLTLMGRNHWGQSDSHPSVQKRIDAVMRQMGSDGTRPSDVIAHAAFNALWSRWSEAPGPFKPSSGSQ